MEVSSLKEIEQVELKADQQIQAARAESENLFEQLEKDMVEARKKAIDQAKRESSAKIEEARKQAEAQQDQMLKEGEEECAAVAEQAGKNLPQAVQAAIGRLLEH